MSVAPVVVGTDLSTGAREALRQARAFADRVDAAVLITHVASDHDAAVRAAADASRLIREASDGALRVNDSSIVTRGEPAEELVSIAESRGAQLLVVGATGKGAIERMVFGTTAEQCVRRAPCPVLIARPVALDGPVICATDFSDGAEPAVAFGTAEARRRGVPLVLMHVVWEPASPLSAVAPAVIAGPEPTDEERQMRADAARQLLLTLLERTESVGEACVRIGRPDLVIVEEAKTRDASLVVVGTHGRSALSRWALGSVSEAVVRDSGSSVACVRLTS